MISVRSISLALAAMVTFAGRCESAGESFATTVTVHLGPVVKPIPPGIYGQYLEHVQADEQTIYPSLWDSTHPAADATGVRTDVTSAVKDMGVPVVRWPGGCFADVYHWQDGIGPQSARQAKPNLHWGGLESNQFGTDEFLHWCKLSGVHPYINVNLGSGTLDEAVEWVRYCKDRQPAVSYWGIGNETWGPWETGHTDAATYGTSLSLWAKAMRKEGALEILGVGSEEGNNRTWDETVLRFAGADIDLLTVHMYGITTGHDPAEYPAFVLTPAYLENRLRRVIETVDSVGSSLLRRSPVNIAVDEWNIRHFFNGKQDRKSPRTVQDAIFTAGFLNAMIRLSPRVEMANYVFLVNGNGALLVDDKQIVMTPLAMVMKQYSRWMYGSAAEVETDGPVTLPPPPLTGHPGKKTGPGYFRTETPWLDAAAATMRLDGTIAVALVNRHQTDVASVRLELPDGYGIAETWSLGGDIYASNTFAEPDKVLPVLTVENGKRRDWNLAPHSISLLLCKD